MASKKVIEKLSKMTESEIDDLVEAMDIGITINGGGTPDKEEKVMIISTENDPKIINALNRIKGKKVSKKSEKLKISQMKDQEYSNGRVYTFTIENTEDLHVSIIEFLLDLGISKDKALEFDIDYSSCDANIFAYGNGIRVHLIGQESEITLIIDTKIKKESLIEKLEKYFKIF